MVGREEGIIVVQVIILIRATREVISKAIEVEASSSNKSTEAEVDTREMVIKAQ